MIANPNGCEHTHTICGTGADCGHGDRYFEELIYEAKTLPKLEESMFAPIPNSKKERRKRNSNKPFE